MLPAPDDDLVFHRLSRANVEVRVPLRLLPARVCLLSAAEAKAALPAEDAPERIFVVRYSGSNPNPNPNQQHLTTTEDGSNPNPNPNQVRYSGGQHGGPVEPVQILPEVRVRLRVRVKAQGQGQG